MGVGLAEFVREGVVVQRAALDLVHGDDALDAVGEEDFIGPEDIFDGEVTSLGFVVGEDEGARDAASATGLVGRGEEMGPSPPEEIAARDAGDKAVLVEKNDFGR